MWKNTHIFCSLLIAAAGICHVVFNWNVLWNYWAALFLYQAL